MKILIAGLAKTGTTGLLYLVANSLAGTPRLLFEPRTCPAGLQSESGDVIAKILIGPGLNAASFFRFEKKITLLRDPRDRLISSILYSQYHAPYLNDTARVDTVRQCLERKESNPASLSLREILEAIGRVAEKPETPATFRERAERALECFEEYVDIVRNALLYKYEDFVSGDYRPLEKHLGMKLEGPAEVPDRLSRVDRTRGCGDWRNWFTPEDVSEFQPLFSPWLEKYGYDAADWKLNARPAIAPEHCSGYFMRLVETQRTKSAQKARRAAGGAERAAAGRTLTGQVMRAEPELVAGWAIGARTDQPVRVALVVNGSEVARTLADVKRPGLKERGIHPSGRCGFIFRLESGRALKVGDQVSVTPVDQDFVLDNCPCTVSAGGPTTRIRAERRTR